MANFITETDFTNYMGSDVTIPTPFQMWYDMAVASILTICPCLECYLSGATDCEPPITAVQTTVLQNALILQMNYLNQYDDVINSPVNTRSFSIGDYSQTNAFPDSRDYAVYRPVINMLFENFDCSGWVTRKWCHCEQSK